MDAVLRMIGSETVLVIPPSILKTLRIGAGQRLTLEATADGKIVLTPTRKFVLTEMIAQCDPNAAPPADLAAWDALRPVGQEIQF
ncbi:ChpB-ChpS toxin-antitoxin system antitoxin [Pseudorhodoferax sp. LjRoot39]|uniref:AbrB/MazE/SpoVT family DNA-binding domain-containing protein n=1 Tax=Pseudorhodoferax sp. LjRoot39 TaxID=3342328 RepID=UPI003ECE3881